MFIPDMPNVPPQNVPVMIAQANQAQSGDVTSTRSMGVCFPVSNLPASLTQNVLAPIVNAVDYFHLYEHQDMPSPPVATVTLLQSTKHGELSDGEDGYYIYLPERGYVGKDNAIYLVDFGGGNKVKVVYFLQAIEGFYPSGDWEKEYCSKTGYQWKISSTLDANGNSTITSVEYQSPIINAGATSTDTAALTSTLESKSMGSDSEVSPQSCSAG